ncbi:MAG: sugar ABC transporter substrate-binding protein, partial [Oscillospiraceae bacterium]
MKKIVVLLLAAVMVLGLAACAKPAENENGDGTEKRTITIAWSDDTLDSTRSIILEACKARVAEINAERDDIEVVLNYYEARGSVDQQISDVETACLTKPDVFLFSCVDSEGSKPCLQTMKDAGAYILDIRDIQDDRVDVTFFGSDEDTYAKATTSWIKAYLEANPDEVIQCGLIYGNAAQTLQLKRCDLMKDLAAEMPDRVQIVAEAYGDWDTQKAMSISEDWIQAHPEINFICAANDIMAKGASNALVAAGIKDKVILTGIDLDTGPELIADGKQDLDVGASITDNDYMIDIAVMLAEGTWTGGDTYTLTSVMAVDTTNIQDYLAGNY